MTNLLQSQVPCSLLQFTEMKFLKQIIDHLVLYYEIESVKLQD